MDILYLFKREMLRRKYSLRTIKTYGICISNFLRFCHKDPKKFTKKDIKDYLDEFVEKDLSGSTINVNLHALKFMMEEVLHRPKTFYHIKYSKTPRKLPEVLTKEETRVLLRVIENKKHKLMIRLMYSAGLRVSELVGLRVRDFEFDNNYGWVRHGKGNKDRLFIIAKSIKNELLDYIAEVGVGYDSWVFMGIKEGHISTRTIYEIVKKAAKKAKIGKKIHPHTLRHSYSTHLIENGYDVATVQSLLGHSSAETTMLYLHMASPTMINVRSPLDSLERDKLQSENSYEKRSYGSENFDSRGLESEEYKEIKI
ncbi:MAG: site-specific tyrosine recombinase/integron integrase [Candidatus Woesearchaeota archaeon]